VGVPLRVAVGVTDGVGLSEARASGTSHQKLEMEEHKSTHILKFEIRMHPAVELSRVEPAQMLLVFAKKKSRAPGSVCIAGLSQAHSGDVLFPSVLAARSFRPIQAGRPG
jgi:hypothetical protein